MTELETMKRAKMYMDKLAQGIDPITNQRMPGDASLSNARLSRCFSYVSDVLDKVIANGGVVGQVVKTLDFQITPEQLRLVRICEYPVRITEFTDALYQPVNNPEMKKPSTTKITEWLILEGLMKKENGSDGKTRRIPTEKGLQMGMSTRQRQSKDGEYLAVYYDKNMQRFMLNHLPEILSGNK